MKRGKPLKRTGFKRKTFSRAPVVRGTVERPPNYALGEHAPQPKVVTHRDRHYLAWCRRQRCANCSAPPRCEPSHHGVHGTGIKPDDRGCIPLCFRCHHLSWHSHGAIYGREQLTREERREWLRQTAREHYARYLQETRHDDSNGDTDIGQGGEGDTGAG